jgi:hypothetical protein
MKVRRLTIAARIAYCVESNELDRLVQHEYEHYKIEIRGRRVALFREQQDAQPADLFDERT